VSESRRRLNLVADDPNGRGDVFVQHNS